jgi:hypothetical protein
MKNSAESIGLAEKQLGHFWDPKDDPAPPKRNYFVPNFGMDEDVKSTITHLKTYEAKFGKMETPEITW